ncbi:hypothetical protein ABBQ38_009045 [Trebouxia sp. C0009 RCD-2024]
MEASGRRDQDFLLPEVSTNHAQFMQGSNCLHRKCSGFCEKAQDEGIPQQEAEAGLPWGAEWPLSPAPGTRLPRPGSELSALFEPVHRLRGCYKASPSRCMPS